MAGDGSDDFEPKDAVSPLPPRREPALIEGKAEPEEGAGKDEPLNLETPAAGSPSAVDEAPIRALGNNSSPPPKKSGGLALPLSILFGALIAVGGAFGLHYYDTSSSAVGEFQSRLDELSQKTDSLSGKADSLGAANTALAEKVETLETEVHKPAEPAQNEEADQAAADLQKRLSALEESVTALSKPADTANSPAPDDVLQKKVAALEDSIESFTKTNANLQAEVQKIADAQQKSVADKQSAAPPVQVNFEPLIAKLSNKLEGRLTSLEASVAAAKTELRAVQDKQAAPQPVVDLGPLDARLSKLAASLSPMEASLSEVKTNLHAVQDKLAAPPPAQDQNAAILAITLLQRVQQGLPFETELSAISNFNVDPAKLSLLKASASKGVASARSLSEELRQLAPSLIKESEKSPPGQSFIDRLAGDAAHLVRIERAGDETSTDVTSLINRIETALDQNDVDAAYTLWLQLPQQEKAISAGFGGALKARIESVNASWSIASDAVANLSKSKS